jgi:hypothetical protein
MGDVIEMPRRAAKRDEETRAALMQMLAETDRGELLGSIHITETEEGTRFYTLGACKERLQMGVLSMVRCLNNLVEQVAAAGTAGNTKGMETIAFTPRRTLPKRLREATGFGEL